MDKEKTYWCFTVKTEDITKDDTVETGVIVSEDQSLPVADIMEIYDFFSARRAIIWSAQISEGQYKKHSDNEKERRSRKS